MRQTEQTRITLRMSGSMAYSLAPRIHRNISSSMRSRSRMQAAIGRRFSRRSSMLPSESQLAISSPARCPFWRDLPCGWCGLLEEAFLFVAEGAALPFLVGFFLLASLLSLISPVDEALDELSVDASEDLELALWSRFDLGGDTSTPFSVQLGSWKTVSVWAM